MRKLFLLLILLMYQAGWAQGDLNLDFERVGPGGDLPGGWYFGGPDYSAALSSYNPASGKRCLTIKFVQAKSSAFAFISTRLPGSLVAGQVIRLEGMIRTATDSEYITAGYFARADDERRQSIAFASTYDQSVGKPGEWTTVLSELNVPDEAVSVSFGDVFSGKGELSLDALQLYIDGVRYVNPHEIEKDRITDAPPGSPYADWFRQELQFRKVGTVKAWSEFGSEDLTEAYDIIFFVGSSSATQVLPVGVLYGYE